MEKAENIRKKYNRIYSIAGQLNVIVLLVAVFFAAASLSPLIDAWPARFIKAVHAGLAISAVLLAGLFAGGIYIFRRQQKGGGLPYEWIGMGLMLIVHYLIRVRMVGTLQMDEGLTCYLALKKLSFHPEMIWENFSEAGKLAGRTAYGYNFFALMGEFLLPGTGHGFQWVQLFMGMAASCCLYGIFRRLFPALKPFAAWTGAFVVSVQPLFLGLSTMCGLEYGMTVFFIYAFYCCVNKKYILMVFWLFMLGTTKSTGTIMALSFFGLLLAAMALEHYKKGGGRNAAGPAKQENAEAEDGPEIDFKSGFIAAAALLAMGLLAAATVRICRANGIAFSWNYIGVKISQLFVLNFNWIWTIIVLIGICMVIVNFRVRRTHKMQLAPAVVLGGCYLVHLAYLIAYTRAGLPRYNMLTDVLFSMIGICLLIKMFQRLKAVLPVMLLVGLCMFGEAFITIDPVTTSLFSVLDTNAFPMVMTMSFKTDKPEYQGWTGDFAYYNFHYTVVEKALNEMIDSFGQQSGDIVVFSNYEGGEKQQGEEILVWDSKRKLCRFAAYGEDVAEYRKVVRIDVAETYTGNVLPGQAIFFLTPWGLNRTGDSVTLLSRYYEVEGPMYIQRRYAGAVEYYYLRLKYGK